MKRFKKLISYLVIIGMTAAFTACQNKETAGPAAVSEPQAESLTNMQAQELMDALGTGLDVMLQAGSFTKDTVGDQVLVGFSIARQKQSYARQFKEGAIDETTYQMMTKQFFDYEISAVSKKYFGKAPTSYETIYSTYHPETESVTVKDWPFSGVTKTQVTELKEESGLYTGTFAIYHFAEEAAAQVARKDSGGYQSKALGTLQAVFRMAQGNPRFPVFEQVTYTGYNE